MHLRVAAHDEVKVGDIAVWGAGQVIAIFFGRTPMSMGPDPVPADRATSLAAFLGMRLNCGRPWTRPAFVSSWLAENRHEIVEGTRPSSCGIAGDSSPRKGIRGNCRFQACARRRVGGGYGAEELSVEDRLNAGVSDSHEGI